NSAATTRGNEPIKRWMRHINRLMPSIIGRDALRIKRLTATNLGGTMPPIGKDKRLIIWSGGGAAQQGRTCPRHERAAEHSRSSGQSVPSLCARQVWPAAAHAAQCRRRGTNKGVMEMIDHPDRSTPALSRRRFLSTAAAGAAAAAGTSTLFT